MTVEALPLKHVADLNPEVLSENTDPDATFRYVDIGTAGRGRLRETPQLTTFEKAPTRARRVLRPGDTILSTVRTYLRSAWTVPRNDLGLIGSTGFVCLRARSGVDAEYLGWVSQSDVVIEEIVARSVGVSYPAISPSEVGQIRVPRPDLRRQRAIAAYLDRKTRRIDYLADSKIKLIRLLEERLMNTAHELTSGNSDRLPLRRLVTLVKTGATPPSDELEDLEGQEVPWYSPGDFSGWLQLEGPARSLQARAITEGWVPRFPAQSVLVVGIGATAGKIAYLSDKGTGNQQITCLVTGPKVEPRFLAWQLLARQNELRETAPFTTLPILNNDFIRSLPISLPPISEQRDAANRLDQEATKLLAVRKREEEQIALLQERRQALITAAVTGQLDIPEAA